MKSSTKWIIGIIIVVGLIWLIIPKTPSGPSIYDDFAKCLTDSGAKMYGAYWCPYCKDQKEMFGSAIQYVNYIECDPAGNHADPEACTSAGVDSYPTWIFSSGERKSGTVPLRELSAITGCELPA